jgi:hypothetical protein
MDPVMFLVCVVWILLGGLPCLGLAYAIGWRKKLHLISGYDSESVSDPEGLARWVGGCNVMIGVLNCVAPLVLLAAPGHLMAVVLVSVGLGVGLSVMMMVGCRRYQK